MKNVVLPALLLGVVAAQPVGTVSRMEPDPASRQQISRDARAFSQDTCTGKYTLEFRNSTPDRVKAEATKVYHQSLNMVRSGVGHIVWKAKAAPGGGGDLVASVLTLGETRYLKITTGELNGLPAVVLAGCVVQARKR